MQRHTCKARRLRTSAAFTNNASEKMRGSKSWLDRFKKDNPGRVHDPFDEEEDRRGEKIWEATWEFDALPMLFNEIIGALKYRPADYYKSINAWRERLNVKAREQAGVGAYIRTPTTIHMTRCSTQVPDVDGLYGSFKTVLDAMTRSGLIPDDEPRYIKAIQAKHRKVKQDEQGTIIKIKPPD